MAGAGSEGAAGAGSEATSREGAVAEVLAVVREGGLLARERRVLVMLSGGRDSTCLLDVAVELLGADAVGALHVNYGLREDAEGDELHCRDLARRLGVQLDVMRAPAAAPPPPRGLDSSGARMHDRVCERDEEQAGNLQAWARDVRYAEAERLAASRDALIAAGHTSSDQVETVLYRLAASPGRRALLGMTPAEGRLIRPLLGVTREQTAAYCTARGLAWREDESNQDARFARTRVRHGLLPALRALHPAAEANVQRTAALLRGEAELLDGLVDAELGGREEIAVARLRELPEALARLVVVRLAEHAAGTYVPQAGGRVAELLALDRRGGRAELHIGGRAGAVIEDGVLHMVKLPARRSGAARAISRLQAVALPAGVSNEPELGEVLVTAEELQRRVAELGAQISRDYRFEPPRPLLLIGVLKGAVFFLSDLMRYIDVPVEVDFMAVASYGSATDSSGVVRILKDLDIAIEGRDVLIVEDIVDSGLTLQYLLRNLGSRNPASLEVCALLTKPERRKVDLPTRYVGFEIPNRFVVGYGLDYAERHRNLPFVAVLES